VLICERFAGFFAQTHYAENEETLMKKVILVISRSPAMDEDGATMVEYSVMIALIAAVCIGIVTTLGTQVQAAFQSVLGF
jgi:pilus assembly protein Flp/PilA